MNNEIGRKITSLTLMTIMIAGGLTFAVPGAMPAAHAANANLFVSAENSQFDNYMAGPQVIEVVVIDSDINDTDEAKGEPDVTVNGKKLRMVQAVDGNWYGYFADRNQALIADSTSGADGVGLDFGSFCSKDTAERVIGVSFSETNGVAIANASRAVGDDEDGSQTGGTITASCAGATGSDGGSTATIIENNVVREAKDINTSVTKAGQIGINKTGGGAYDWPFVQLYNLNPTGNVVVQYNKGGGVQTTTLTFDTVDNFANTELDRSKYPQNAQIHATITDLWLNIDPTDEDSWTFGTLGSNATTFYQIFDENGEIAGDGKYPEGTSAGSGNIAALKGSLMCEDNCVLKINKNVQSAANDVLTFQDNEDTVLQSDGGTSTFDADDQPVTITEQGPNSGIFGTYDESDTSVLKITSNALRGTSANIDYNETPITVLVGFDFATIDIQATDDEWNSGEEIPVVLVDGDANKNSRVDEDLDLNSVDVQLIPSLRTGDPVTLAENNSTDAAILFAVVSEQGYTPGTNMTEITSGQGLFSLRAVDDGSENSTATILVDKFSKRGILSAADALADGERSLIIDFNMTGADLKETFGDTGTDAGASRLFGFNLFNQDFRGLNSTAIYDVYILNSSNSVLLDKGTTNMGGGSSGAVTAISIVNSSNAQSLTLLNSTGTNAATNPQYDRIVDTIASIDDSDSIGLLITSDTIGDDLGIDTTKRAFAADFFSFGFTDDGNKASERVANQIIRLELEETGDNTSTFEGSLEFVMINQLNILDPATYTGLSTIADDPGFIVMDDLDDEDAPRVNYNDLGADGVVTQVADQQDAPAHSGVVSFDSNSYKIADTVVVTLEDADLNVDSDLIDIFTVVTTTTDEAFDTVGRAGLPINFSFGDLGRLLDVTFDDVQWKQQTTGTCNDSLKDVVGTDVGLGGTGFTLIETGTETGVFIGDFQIPKQWCRSGTANPETTTGLDIEVNYVDYRDASGEIIEVGDSAGVRANTGSVSLDRTVYPVPFGVPSNFASDTTNTTPNGRSVFPIHQSGMNTAGSDRSSESGGTGTQGLDAGEFLAKGDLIIHVRVNDPDFDTSASGEDTIAENIAANPIGPVKVSVIRGADKVVLGYAGGPKAIKGVIDVGGDAKKIGTEWVNDKDGDGVKDAGDDLVIRQFGPMEEIAPDAGIFEADITLRYTDGPASSTCPSTSSFTNILDSDGNTVTDRFDVAASSGTNYCILQGDILQVEYTDPADASGDVNTVTDSATFDLRNGVLQSDKSVYIIGSDMILTLIEPDLDLDTDQAETYDLDLIEWDSDAATISMGNAEGRTSAEKFDPEPTDFRETGDSTGIFQIVIEIPEELAGDKLERGEEIVLEYTDWGPSGSDYVGDEDEDVNLTIYTSNFGATVELDQKVYTWTDKVYITIVAPDHNFDSDLVDSVGETDTDPIKISTRGHSLNKYKLVETGTDTGIFTGEVILTGFHHDADGNSQTGRASDGSDTSPRTGDASGNNPTGRGPTDGFIESDDDDGITVSFEFSEDETVVGSALIRWNIGEVQWLEASYPASGTGVVRVIDPDMNIDPEAVDNFNVDVWSDSDAGGIDLTVTETNEATGIFEGTVFFTTTDESSGHRLRVAEGDTVTAEYEDNTLPDPYTTADELDITATSLIGTVVPPLERAPAANLRTVDAFGNSLDTVSVDQQVQITADLANGQDREQAFAYLVQIQDASGVTVSLAWITGSLSPGQSFSPALSWIPAEAGTYTATAFVWESVDNPTALSPPVTTTITVQ